MTKTAWVGIAGAIVLGVILAWGFWSKDSLPEGVAVVSGHPEWAPIMFRDGEEIKGAGPALVKMILDELGVESVSLYTGTWDEVQAKARTGEVDILAAAYKTQEREEYMVYSEAYVTDPIAIFVRADKVFDFNTWENLVGKKGVGTVGDSYGEAFDEFIAERLDFTFAPDSATGFDLVASGDADYFVYALFAGEREIAKGREGIAILPNFVAEENFYITISKQSPLVERLDDINRLIERYVADGTVERLVAEYKAH